MLMLINGVETPVEFERPLQEVHAAGNAQAYRINYGNGLAEVGGVAEVQASAVADGVIEGTMVVLLPFDTVLDFQATAMNVPAPPSSLTGESVFITPVDGGYKLYATAKASAAQTIPVKWSAKGLA